MKKRTVQGGPRDRILITGVRYPKPMERSNDNYAFTISFVATQNLEEVVMRLRILPGSSLEYPDLKEIDRKDLVERFPPLDLLAKAASTLGINVLPGKGPRDRGR